MAFSKNWWRGAVVYQIYPRSFKDTNGDGVGDLKGIAGKLDYVADLGVDGVWISPFKKSPMKDFGYDVSDYRDVDPLFGTMGDFKGLLDKAHGLGLKIIVDMIFSHTSNQHAWFQESHKSRDNPKADWYVWADPKPDGSEPNNWRSIFGGSAWQYDSWRGQYYMHNFLVEQPDLNFHNPDVQDAVLDVTKFWLDLGVDGLRLDAINYAVHDKSLRDNPARPGGGTSAQLKFVDPYSMQWHQHDKSQPEMLDFLKRLRKLMNQYPGTMTLGEVGDDDEVGRVIEYSGGGDMLDTCYNFTLVQLKPGSAGALRDVIEDYEGKAAGGEWPSWAFSNHDVVRAVSRWAGDYQHDPRIAKMLIALLTSLRGTAFLYQGEELGLPDVKVAYEDLQDPWGKYLYPKWQGRDGCRTPMPWVADAENMGFGGGRPWLPMPESHRPLAVDRQEADKGSTLAFTKAFLKWRKGQAALVQGAIEFIETGSDKVVAFKREAGGQAIYCVFNMGPETEMVEISGVNAAAGFKWSEQSGVIKNGTLMLPSYGIFWGE